MQVYRGMDIGTAKPSPDEQARVPHRMIDVAEPTEDYTVSMFQEAARAAIREAGDPVLIVGGSGLHLRAVIDPMDFLPTDAALRAELEAADPAALARELSSLDPDAGSHVDLANPRRVIRAVEVARLTGRTPSEIASDPRRAAVAAWESELDCRIIGVDRPDIDEATEQRFTAMVDAGLLAEVERLAPTMGRTAAQAVGYKELLPVVTGESPLDAGVEAAVAATRQLVRRQRSWFRRDPRVEWFDALRDDVVSTVMESL